jgi:uncharacterized protein (DUF433 family)
LFPGISWKNKTVSTTNCDIAKLLYTSSNQPAIEKDKHMEQFDRITQQPGIMDGKACIRGMRITAGIIVGQIGAGRSVDEILTDYPYLEREDIMQALRYAAWRAEERKVILASS